MAKVLALNINGDLTFCTCPEELRGTGRCNHIAHQKNGESTQEFVDRIEQLQKENGVKSINDFENDNSFIQYGESEVKTTIYRMSDEEKQGLQRIENRMQLDQNIEGGYISLEEPLWNDMDKNYFAQNYGLNAKSITSILHEDSSIVIKVNDLSYARKYPVGKVFKTEPNKELIDSLNESGVVEIVTGVSGMNRYAKEIHNFEATKDVYVLPYYMRMGVSNEADDWAFANSSTGDEKTASNEIDVESSVISSDITVGYKYLLRNHKNPNKQQLAYEALLNNSSMDSEKARYTNGYRNKSLADEFVGKGGVFRACLSGGSIPYSGRAVITPTIDMKYGELKLPPSLAVDIYKPTLLNQLTREGKSVEEIDAYFAKYRKPQSEISAEDRADLANRIKDKRVLMNRQPSLHTSSLQSFKPLISDNATVQIHPLYCKAYGADFDGDTVSVYGINLDEIIPTIDNELDAHNDINIHLPRSRQSSAIMPDKDALFGLISILSRRSDQ